MIGGRVVFAIFILFFYLLKGLLFCFFTCFFVVFVFFDMINNIAIQSTANYFLRVLYMLYKPLLKKLLLPLLYKPMSRVKIPTRTQKG